MPKHVTESVNSSITADVTFTTGACKVSPGGSFQADVVAEYTAASGVTIDGVLLKDFNVGATGVTSTTLNTTNIYTSTVDATGVTSTTIFTTSITGTTLTATGEVQTDKISNTDGDTIVKFSTDFAADVTAGHAHIIVATTLIVSTNVTVGDRLVEFIGDGMLSVAGGSTVTFISPSYIKSGLVRQIFTGDGTVDFDEPGVLRPEMFGADPTDATDDKDAIEACLLDGMTVMFSHGEYRSSGVLAYSGSGISLIGAGMEQSAIYFTTASSGLSLASTAYNDPFVVKDISLRTANVGANGTKGIQFNLATVGRTNGSGLLVQDVCIEGKDINTNYWNYGIHLVDGWYTHINRVYIDGLGTNYNTAEYGIVGTGECVDVKITQCGIYYYQNGIYIGAGESEGWYIDTVTIVGGNNGITWITTAQEPFLTIVNSHCNNYLYPIRSQNGKMTTVSNCFTFSDRSEGNTVGIYIDGEANQSSVIGNTIEVNGTGNSAWGIVVNADYATVMGNIGRGVAAALNFGVYFGETSSYCTGIGNVFQSATVGVTVHAGSTGNVLASNIP